MQIIKERFLFTASVAAILALGCTVHAQNLSDFFPEMIKITPESVDSNDYFGHSICLSGDTAMISAPHYLSSKGRVFIYERQIDGSWTESGVLDHPNANPGSSFGNCIAISGTTAVIGAMFDDSDKGSAHVFERQQDGSWIFTVELSDASAVEGDQFGTSVGISGSTIVVGAIETYKTGPGKAYVWERQPNGFWSEVAQLSPSDGGPNDRFGISVAIEDETIIIGAVNNDSTGSAYIFERQSGDTWLQTSKLYPSDGIGNGHFGKDVSILGSTVLINMHNHHPIQAFLFSRQEDGSWLETDIMATPYSGANVSGYYHDRNVVISDSIALVGVPFSPTDGGSVFDFEGSAHAFERQSDGTWAETIALSASDIAQGDSFGGSIAASDDTIVVGATRDDDNGSNSGSAYIFNRYEAINLDYGNRGYSELTDALDQALSGDRIAIRGLTFFENSFITTGSKSINFIAVQSIEIPDSVTMQLSSGTSFSFSDDIDQSGLNFILAGNLYLPENGQITLDTDFFATDEGVFFQNGSTVLSTGLFATWGSSTAYMSGTLLTDLVWTNNSARNIVYDETMVLGDYLNEASTIVHRGTLYITGDLTNNGVMLGEVNTSPGLQGDDLPSPGDGFSIGGSYTLGAGSTLSMPDPVWWLRVGGDLDIAIDDPMRFSMADATIELTGLSRIQSIEVLSADLGANEAGFDSTNFPIRALRINGNANVQLVDNHINTTGTPCEVFYVDELVVSAGGTLLTNGCPIYARNATIDGTVDDPENIIIVKNGCVGDLDGNGFVNGADLASVLGAWGINDSPADFDGDGDVDGADLAVVLGAWGACPE